ncbi:uncharacterized protein (DUF2147 family) [Actinokineospora baliensis]|uniref:RICIN domain-containing protein n=1 Tax=Actinokineospora baliensis TaxID=547056 RepID=UPI00195E909A|nr:ricin-type beta-trefoil lectin domain protein [Actinokineospora baliensis]MBM7773219.1 uncharacterized protein (DUF2147 family) [Actinokineospora baliensis]
MRRSLRTLITIAAAAPLLLTATPANASTTPNRPAPEVSATAEWIQIRSLYGSQNQCLDADLNGGGANGTKVQLWDCNGSDQQQWLLDFENKQLINKKFWACLDADLNGGGANGTKLQLWTCNSSDQQKWLRYYDDLAIYNGRFFNGKNTVVDRDVSHGGNGAKAQLWAKNFQPQQWWEFE